MTYSINYNNTRNNTTTSINTANNTTSITIIDNNDTRDTIIELMKKLERCLVCAENLQNHDRACKLLQRVRVIINMDGYNNNNINILYKSHLIDILI
jgi:methylthioribose-1-phosphate isomerase